jgi:Protein of unknown function (DUF3987)
MTILQQPAALPKPMTVSARTYPLACDIHGEPEISQQAWQAAHRAKALAPSKHHDQKADAYKAVRRWRLAVYYEQQADWSDHGMEAAHLQVPGRIACRCCDTPLPEVRKTVEAARLRLAEWRRWYDDLIAEVDADRTTDEDSRFAEYDYHEDECLIAQAQAARCPRCRALEQEMIGGKAERIGAAHRMLVDIVRQAERWKGRGPVHFLKPWTAPPFEAADVPDALARYPMLYAEQTGIDSSIGLTAAVGVAAAAVDDAIQICGDRASDWYESARLWTLAVGLPSAGKTPALKRMLVPLEQIEKELLNTYQSQLEIWEAADPESRGPKPGRPCVITTNPTIEAQANILVANERGILLKAEEFGTWVGAMDRYNKDGGDRAYQLSAFDGGPLNMERATEGKSRYVPNWGASLLASTTPAEIERLTGKLGHLDGLLARINPMLARPRVYVEAGQKPQEDRVREERDAYHALIKKLWHLQLRAEGAAVELSQGAQEAFAAWRKELLKLIEGYENREPALATHLGKYETMLLRVALVFHCIECVASSPVANPVTRKVSADTFVRAIRYMRRVEQHATIFHLNASASEAVQLAKAIGWFILARKTDELVLERRALVRNERRFKNADDKLREAALGLLIDYGWLLPVDEGEGYKKALPTRWDLNPALADTFAAEADRERERRELVRERIAEAVGERKRRMRGDRDRDT